MKLAASITFIFAVPCLILAAPKADPSIDRLLKKLPPTEKLVKRGAQIDPAANDPIARDMLSAAEAQKFGRALSLSRRLCKKYPRSAPAHCIRGILAFSQNRFAEAAGSYRATIAIEPRITLAYLGLGAAEAAQNHYAAALSSYQKSTQLEPKAEIGWLGSSVCAEKLGRRQDSVVWAKKATTVAPSSFLAWLQLARAEKAAGHDQAALKALARSNNLRRSTRATRGQTPDRSRNEGRALKQR